MTKSTILLFLTFFFTACMERGYTLKPLNTTVTKPIVTKTSKSTLLQKPSKTDLVHSSKKAEEKNVKMQENKIIEKKMIMNKPSKDIDEAKNDIFSLTEETKNKVSGFFILVIGLMILL